MSTATLAADFINRMRLFLSKRYYRWIYDRIYFSHWLTRDLHFFNLGLSPVDSEIKAIPWLAGEQSQAQSYLEVVKAFRRHLPDRSPERLLEVSTGLGGGMLLLANCFPSTVLFGIDFSPNSIRRTRNLVADAQLVLANAHRIPFSEASFSLLLNVESLHALDAPVFFQEAGRLVADEGLLVIVDFKDMSAVELMPWLESNARSTGFRIVEFRILSHEVLQSADADTRRRALLERRIPFAFKSLVNEMTAGPGSELRRQYESDEKTYFLCAMQRLHRA